MLNVMLIVVSTFVRAALGDVSDYEVILLL